MQLLTRLLITNLTDWSKARKYTTNGWIGLFSKEFGQSSVEYCSNRTLLLRSNHDNFCMTKCPKQYKTAMDHMWHFRTHEIIHQIPAKTWVFFLVHEASFCEWSSLYKATHCSSGFSWMNLCVENVTYGPSHTTAVQQFLSCLLSFGLPDVWTCRSK